MLIYNYKRRIKVIQDGLFQSLRYRNQEFCRRESVEENYEEIEKWVKESIKKILDTNNLIEQGGIYTLAFKANNFYNPKMIDKQSRIRHLTPGTYYVVQEGEDKKMLTITEKSFKEKTSLNINPIKLVRIVTVPETEIITNQEALPNEI